MTIQELYARIGGNYEHAVQIMKSDRLIDKYVRRLKNSQVGETLARAGETMDATGLFESAHAMKGVCANLGLDDLARAADEITEEFRPGSRRRLSDDEVKARLQAVLAQYRATEEGIQAYEENA